MNHNSEKMLICTKGQIISKGLFGILEFSQKTNERIRHSSKNEFVRSFFGRIRGYQKSFRNYLTFSHTRGNKTSKTRSHLQHTMGYLKKNLPPSLSCFHFPSYFCIPQESEKEYVDLQLKKD